MIFIPAFGQKLLKKDNGDIWIASSNGIIVLDSNLLLKKRIIRPAISNDTINYLIEDKNKNVWVSTDLWLHKIKNDNIESFAQYIESESKIETLVFQKVNKYKKALPIYPQSARLLKTIKSDTIWALTSFGLYYIHNDSIINTNMNSAIGLSIKNENIYAHSIGNDKYKFSNGTWIKHNESKIKNINYDILEFIRFSDDGKWMCTNEGLFSIKNNKAKKESNLSFEIVKTMPNKDVWFGGNGGIAILSNNSKIYYQNISLSEKINISGDTYGQGSVDIIDKNVDFDKNTSVLSFVIDFIAIGSNKYLILDSITGLFLFKKNENLWSKIEIP